MTAVDPVAVEFDNRLADHLAAERLYYRSTFLWKMDKVVASPLRPQQSARRERLQVERDFLEGDA